MEWEKGIQLLPLQLGPALHARELGHQAARASMGHRKDEGQVLVKACLGFGYTTLQGSSSPPPQGTKPVYGSKSGKEGGFTLPLCLLRA